MKLTVAQKLLLGFGSVLLLMCLSTLVLFLNIRASRQGARTIHDESLPFARAAAEMRLASVNVQQFLTDVSATHDPGGLAEAKEQVGVFNERLQAFRAMFEREGDRRMAAEIDGLGQDFAAMYDTGLAMTEAYLKQGLEAGNAIMERFDAAVARLDKRLDELQQTQFREADGLVSHLENGLQRTLVLQVGLLAASLVLAGLIAWLITRSLLRQLGAEPEEVARLAHCVASGDLEAACGTEGDASGVYAAMLDMAAKLRGSFGEVRARQAEAEDKTRQAETARRESEAATERAHSARREGLREAADRLEDMVASLSSASEELSAQVEQARKGSDLQRERSAETATAMEEMNATVLEVAGNASKAAESADAARTKAEAGAATVERVVAAIGEVHERAEAMKAGLGELGAHAEGIGRIMTVITDIADQTNLLALNAAIEAARAGDAGRGFAVVADEVRKLAEKTMTATKEVGQAVERIQSATRRNIEDMDGAAEAVARSTGLAGEAGQALAEIVDKVETTTDMVRSIATASEEQSSASEEINRSVEDVSRISSETAQGMAQSSEAVNELATLAARLRELIERLREE